ncbi:MAG: hypothetical protein D3910_25245 [Candidatus Electrothrix sp. ATG2]|nr:hypothetical protein [Candidatus Electrothrix sp. ATG2]
MGQDTYRGRLREPRSLHRFGYVLNNPVTYWDWYGFINFSNAEICKGMTYAECYNNGDTGYIEFTDNQQVDIEQFEDLLHAVYDNLKSRDIKPQSPFQLLDELISERDSCSVMSAGFSVIDQLSFDTPFYNPYVPNRLDPDRTKKEESNVCFGDECYTQSDVNYFAMGMYYASSDTSLLDMYLIIYAYKGAFNQNTPSEDTLFWATLGYFIYLEYEGNEN